MSDNKNYHFCENVSSSIRDFTLDFYKSVAGKAEGNFVSSALSAHMVLSMSAYGASGSTAEQMRRALHLPEKDEQAHEEFKSFIEFLNNVAKVDLKIANKLCIANTIPIVERFKEMTSKIFHSEHAVFDFKKADESAESINDWCLKCTNDKISDVVKAEDFNEDTALVLLNAVYFKGNWKHKFNVDATYMKPFHVNNTTTIEVPTMHITEDFGYQEIPELDALCVYLPYVNEDLQMQIIVPNQIDGLGRIEQNLDKVSTCDYFTQEIELALPKFKIETDIDLKQHLIDMGMTEMFTDCAQFTNISEKRTKINKVKQKAFIEVNEEGSEAAAVTCPHGYVYCCYRPTPKINVDRPFVCRIVWKNFTLFAGRVISPLQK